LRKDARCNARFASLADVDELLNCFQRHWSLRIDG
jgi:hypothetical protein